MLEEILEKNGITNKSYCSAEETNKFLECIKLGKEIPKDILKEVDEVGMVRFYRAGEKMDINEVDVRVKLKQLETLKSIDKTLTFFKVMTVISLLLGIFAVILSLVIKI